MEAREEEGEAELRRRPTTVRGMSRDRRRQGTAQWPGWSSPGRRRRNDEAVSAEGGGGAADESEDITLSSTTGVAGTVGVCLLLTWWGIEPWDVISAITSIAVIVLTLYLPRSLLVAAMIPPSSHVDQPGQPQPVSRALTQLWRRRTLATALLVAAPAAQFYAITHLHSLSDTPGWRVLNPGFVAICSSLYALHTITRDHVVECARLQAKRERGDRLSRRIATLEAAVADIRHKLDGYKGVLQSSIHAIARVRSGEGETEGRLEDLAAQIERLQRRLSHHERAGSMSRRGSLSGSPMPHFEPPLFKEHNRNHQHYHRPTQGHGHPPLRRRIVLTITRLITVLVAVEWPWTKARRVLRVLTSAAMGDFEGLGLSPSFVGRGGTNHSGETDDEEEEEATEEDVFEAHPRHRRRRLTSSSSTQTPLPAELSAHERAVAQSPSASTPVTTAATATTSATWAERASTPHQVHSSASLGSVISAASEHERSGFVAVNGERAHPQPRFDNRA